ASLIENCEMLLTLLPAHGAAIRVGGEIALAGRCPGPEQVRAVTDWVIGRGSELVSTDRLPAEFAPATEFGAAASGIAATVVSSSEPLLALWFRAEQIEV